MDGDVSYSVPKSGGFSGGAMSNSNPTGSARGTAGSTFVTAQNSPQTTYTLQTGDMGKTLCQRINWSPRATFDGGTGSSSDACVRVMYTGGVSEQLVFDPSATVINDGTLLTIKFIAGNTTPIAAPVNYNGYVWYDRNNNDVLDAGETKEYTLSGSTTLSNSPATIELGQHALTADITKAGRICGYWDVASTDPLISNLESPKLTCVYIGQRPQLQAWGSDVRTGSALNLSGAAASKIAGIVTKRDNSPTSTSFSGSSEFGLWRTGVDASGNKISLSLPSSARSGSSPSDKSLYAPNLIDQHWTIKEVIRPSGTTAGTCQFSFDGVNTGTLVSMAGETPAYIITESGGSAGMRATRASIVGNRGAGSGSVWNRTSPVASWIGQNVYGQNYSSSSCLDPSTANTANYDNANIYKYQLKDAFTIPADADLSSVKLTINGAIDNRVKAFVNGCQLLATGIDFPIAHNTTTSMPVTRTANWLRSGYWSGSPSFTLENANNPGCQSFKHGKSNTLEIWAQSTLSHTGLLIENISLSGMKSVSTQTIFGSWAEYGVFAPQPTPLASSVSGFASATGFMGGGVTEDQATWSKLTFANTNPYGSFASPAGMGMIPNIGRYLTQVSTGVVPPTNVSTVTIGPGGIDPSTLASGSHVINATGVVTITGDVIRDPTTTDQLVIIAPSINIIGAVRQIDAWLIAPQGTIDTCTDGPPVLTRGDCNVALKVNGPITAKQLSLRRTAGADKDTPGDAAETFNLRGDAYIWAHRLSHSTSTYQTTGLRELPPRY